MASESGYTYLLSAEVFSFCERLRSTERRPLGEVFRFLAMNPFLRGDYQETGGDGRTLEILLRGQFVFTFWTDHAVKEVRILRIDRA